MPPHAPAPARLQKLRHPSRELQQPHPHVPLRPRLAQAAPPLAAPAAAAEDAPPVRAPSEAAEQLDHRSQSQPGCAQARLDGACAVRFLAEPTKSVAVNANRRLVALLETHLGV